MRETVTDAPDTFASFVGKQSTDLRELPLIHSTECFKARQIASDGNLRTSKCDVFEDALLYFFYGRPAYRSRGGVKPSTEAELCPVCFVVKPDAISGQIHRVFPFDSGASATGKFAPYVTESTFEDFEINGSLESVRRLVALFFETNGNYYLGRARDLTGKQWPDDETECYYGLISHAGKEWYDERRSAVECQIRDDVALHGNVLAVVLPTAFLEDQAMREKIEGEWDAKLIKYPTYHGSIPSHYHAVIRDRLHGFLEKGGYL